MKRPRFEMFFRLFEGACGGLLGEERLVASFAAEESDFVRFNQGRVRQAGSVAERWLTIDLVEGRRHAAGRFALCGDEADDRAHLRALIDRLREYRSIVADDPHLVLPSETRSTETGIAGTLPGREEAVEAMLEAGRDLDLVGICATGTVASGFADSNGQRNTHSVDSFNFDWSLYAGEDRAVKASCSGSEWSRADFDRRARQAAADLEILRRAPRTIAPGDYRAYLSPAALSDVFGLLAWGAFGLRAQRTRTTPLLRMLEEGARLHPSVTVVENTAGGLAPAFQEQGFPRPPRVALIEGGSLRDTLVSPRSAAEYAVACNGAAAAEAPLSLEMAAGDLARDHVCRRLGTGVYVANLHYLNYSDRPAGRITGLTRFATLWVEDGNPVAPLSVMRFDDTLYRLLGENLVALTRERERLLDPETYAGRSLASVLLPGALIEDFRFTS